MPDDANDLLEAWMRSRDERAFRALVERYLPQVLATAARVTGSADLARDVAQQSFIRLATRPPRLGRHLSLAAWLHTTTRSLAIDLVRSESSRRRREQTVASAHAMPQEPAADWSRLSPVIDAAISALPAADREILILRFLDGESHGRIGTRLGLTENTARMRVNRALEKLRVFLGRRGITTTAAALALALPACAATPVPAGLALAISSSSLAHAATAASGVALTAISLLVKKTLVISAILIAAAVPVWRHAVSRPQAPTASAARAPFSTLPETDTTASGTPDTRPSNERRPIRSAGKPSPAAHGLALARIENAVERDEALTAWMAGFSNHGEIVDLIAALRAERESNATLRALIAPHLTRRWATVDGAACTTAHLREGGLFRRDPLDSNNNPFAARDSEATTPCVNLFTLIAETNPAAFNTWLESAPADLIPALLGDPASPTWQAWAAADGSGETTIRGMDPILAQDFHKGDFANLIASRDPDLLLRPAVDGRDLGLGRRYYSGLMEKLGEDGGFSANLMKSHTADQLWDIFAKVSELSPGADHNTNTAFLKLAQAELVATPGTVESRATAAAALPASHRQATTLAALFDSLEPASGDDYWAGVNTVAKAVNDIASKADAEVELTLVNAYSDLRKKIAGTLAKESIDEALEWTGSIRDQRNRASCLMQIAAQEIKPGVHAWASGEIGAEEADEPITMHFEDRTTDPPRVSQFTLRSVAGETLPQYYTRLRSALRKQLDAPPTVDR